MKYFLIPLLFGAAAAHGGIPEIPFATYIYSASNCSQLTHPSGSKIFIPDHAFVPACDGKVTIRYREFHSQADMVVGNIPMDFLQGKNERHLESGGMFEIYAECNGTELKLAPGKKIQVRFAARQNLEGMSPFSMDKNKGWQLLPTPVINMAYSPEDKFDQNLWGSGPPSVNIGSAPVDGEWMESDWIQVNDSIYVSYDAANLTFKKDPVIFMGMDISQMGLFNYDRILNEEESIPFAADFRIKGEKMSLESKIYVTYSGLNTVVYYTPDEWEKKFSLLPRKDLKIFCMLKDGRVAVMMPSEIQGLDLKTLRNKKHTFELVIGDIKPETKEELASVAGIQP